MPWKNERLREQAHYANESIKLDQATAALRDLNRWKREKRTAPPKALKKGGRTVPGNAIVNPEFVRIGRIDKSFPKANKNLLLRSPKSKGFSNTLAWRCYWNSMLQVLLHAPPVYHLLGNIHRNCNRSVEECVVCALQQLAQEYWNGGDGKKKRLTKKIDAAVRARLPSNDANLRDYHDNAQNDSAVYLNWIVGELERQAAADDGDDKVTLGLVRRVFYFHSQRHMDCVVCGEREELGMNRETFGFTFNLRGPEEEEEEEEEVEVEEEEEEEEEGGEEEDEEGEEKEEEEEVEEEDGEIEGEEDQGDEAPDDETQTSDEGEEQVDPNNNIEFYILNDNLREQQAYTCPSATCQLLQANPNYEKPLQTRETLLHFCPELLRIEIGRFGGGNQGEKITTDVDFPEVINLGPYTPTPDVPVLYRFSGLVAHQGFSVNSGHYISVVRNPADQTFRVINDKEVESTHDFEQDVKLPGTKESRFQPYVLCYTKC